MQETQETWVRSLSWEVPLEEVMATHSSVLALGILFFWHSQLLSHLHFLDLSTHSLIFKAGDAGLSLHTAIVLVFHLRTQTI